jgi:hypothetical protein
MNALLAFAIGFFAVILILVIFYSIAQNSSDVKELMTRVCCQ